MALPSAADAPVDETARHLPRVAGGRLSESRSWRPWPTRTSPRSTSRLPRGSPPSSTPRFPISSTSPGRPAGRARRLLGEVVRERRNVLVAGGTASGKTTLVNALLHEITGACRATLLRSSAPAGGGSLSSRCPRALPRDFDPLALRWPGRWALSVLAAGPHGKSSRQRPLPPVPAWSVPSPEAPKTISPEKSPVESPELSAVQHCVLAFQAQTPSPGRPA
jgi:hypothetical protein